MVLWEPKQGKRSVGGQASIFVDLLQADTHVPWDCLPAAMDDRVDWKKRSHGGFTEVNLVVVVLLVTAD